MKFEPGIYFYLLLMVFSIAFSSHVCAQEDASFTSEQSNVGENISEDINSPNDSSVVSDDESSAAELDPEHYRRRVRYEVITSVVILLLFFFFVALISMFRFKRGIKYFARLNREKKMKYQDIWGNPRVQQDDMPTDKEMQGIDELDDEDF